MITTTRTLTALAALGLTAGSANAASITYDFTGITTAIDTTVKTASASSNTFTDGVTASDYTFTIISGSGRDTAIKDGQTKAEPGSGDQTHVFSVIIPDLGGLKTVSLTNLSFDFDTTNYDNPLPSESNPAGWELALNQGTADTTSGSPSAKALTPYSIGLTGLTGLNDTTVTFTITDVSLGNNNNLNNFYTGFDNVVITGEVVEVPEPGSLALLGLGGLLIAGRRRA